MGEIKTITPNIKYRGPRWVELLVRAIIFVLIAHLISFMGISGKSDHIYQDETKFIIATLIFLLLYYIYKLFINHMVTNRVVIDNNNKILSVHYSLGYLFERIKRIDFNEFSFWINEHEIFIMGNSVGLYIYENNKFVLRINSRNGWSKKQIYELRDKFLEISNGKMIKKKSII